MEEQKEGNTLVNIILAEGIQTKNDQTFIVDPVLKFKTKFMPTAFSFAISVTITNFQDFSDHKTEVFLVKDTPGIDVKNAKKITSTGEKSLKNNQSGLNFRLNWNLNNVDFETTGRYIVVCVFDECVYQQPFYLESDEDQSNKNK